MIYPTKIEANGRFYDINTNYQTALSCYKAIEDEEINDTERALAIITLLLGKEVLPEDYEICLEKCAIYLRCGKEENIKPEQADMDYFQDEKYIRIGIRQCFGLDLNKIEYLHWYEYNELIENLSEDTVLNKRRELRNLDLNDISDEKRRRELSDAKEKIALKKKQISLNEQQQKSVENFCQLMGGEINGWKN